MSAEEYASRKAWRVGLVLLPLILLPLFATGSGTGTVQNACDGVLRTYGRCETGTATITLPECCAILPQSSFPSLLQNIIFPTPFTNTPSIFYSFNSNGGRSTESDLIMYANNGTRTGGTCVGCSVYSFPAAKVRTQIPGGSGWWTVQANDGFQFNNFPSEPTNALLEMNINSISNATANGRTFLVQGFDQGADGVDCLNGLWENITYSTPFRTNFGTGDLRGFLTGIQGSTGGAATINGTLWNDVFNTAGVLNCQGDLQLRVVGTLTSGHETISYSKILIAFFYTFPFFTVNAPQALIATTGFGVVVFGPATGIVTLSWKAVSETG